MSFNVKDGFDNEDRAVYDLGKFFELCSQMNPNIVELLFIPNRNIVYIDDRWKKVLAHKGLFLSKKCRWTFLGYSVAQWKKLERHRSWFFNPPNHQPTRKEFDLKEAPSFSMMWINELKSGINYDLLKDEFKDEIRREKEYKDAKKKWDDYVQWQERRNPKRKASEEKVGYDGKMASHTFRLASEGKELLLDGLIRFPRPDANFLLGVKNGDYSYEEISSMAYNIENNFKKWYDESPLPHSPNINELKELYFDIVLGDR
jgi:hypothetical protein